MASSSKWAGFLFGVELVYFMRSLVSHHAVARVEAVSKHRHLFVVFAAVAMIAAVLVVLTVQAVKFDHVRRDIAALTCGDVADLMVYDRPTPTGAPRRVSDPEMITKVLSSLQVGSVYRPDHDRHNGFERCVVLEPHHLKLEVYQRAGEESSVIVGVGPGFLRCPDPDIWKEL